MHVGLPARDGLSSVQLTLHMSLREDAKLQEPTLSLIFYRIRREVGYISLDFVWRFSYMKSNRSGHLQNGSLAGVALAL